jgi:hypothetical protein
VTAFARRREYHKGIVAHLSLSSTLWRTIAKQAAGESRDAA